jgi:predicted enzyme related to lactoylglutathione lyase
MPAQWVLSFTVEQADLLLSRIVEQGGTILIDFNDPLSDGSVAIIEDPMGAIFILQKGNQ